MQHFPERLAAVWVVELPTGFTSAFRAVSMELPPATRARVHACTAGDPRLPMRAKQLDAFAAAVPRTVRTHWRACPSLSPASRGRRKYLASHCNRRFRDREARVPQIVSVQGRVGENSSFCGNTASWPEEKEREQTSQERDRNIGEVGQSAVSPYLISGCK